MNQFKLGRHPRKFDPRIPHLSSFGNRVKLLAPPPTSCDYLSAMPSDLGPMLNNALGCCTIAGMYHGRQILTFNANPPMENELDSNVQTVYSAACGYVPGDPSTDNGGNEQDVLTYWMNQGIPIIGGIDKLDGFFEVDPRNQNDVKWTITDCGFSYIGFNVPAYLMNGNIPEIWDVRDDGDQTIIGGHCVDLAAFDTNSFGVMSWGQKYRMTAAFFAKFVDEAYGPIDGAWITAKGTTPGGLTLDQLKAQMQALRVA